MPEEPILGPPEYAPLHRAVAEFIGTFALIFVGAGSVVTYAYLFHGLGAPSSVVATYALVGVALAHGLVIAVMVSAVGHISGGHFNPAVTFGFLVTRRLAPVLAVIYWVTQLA